MKLLIAALVIATVAAGPAAAQGTFNSGRKSSGFQPPVSRTQPAWPHVPAYGSPPGSSSSRPRTYGAPEAPKSPGFQLYEPFSGSSVYSQPRGASRGAKPCETSVYVDACRDRR